MKQSKTITALVEAVELITDKITAMELATPSPEIEPEQSVEEAQKITELSTQVEQLQAKLESLESTQDKLNSTAGTNESFEAAVKKLFN